MPMVGRHGATHDAAAKLRLRWHSWAPPSVDLCKELLGIRLYRLFGSALQRDETAQAQGPQRQLMKEQETPKCALVRSPTWSQDDPRRKSATRFCCVMLHTAVIQRRDVVGCSRRLLKGATIRRRDFITLVGAVAARPVAALAQWPMPVIGFLIGCVAGRQRNRC
jgi:hypothetical protein